MSRKTKHTADERFSMALLNKMAAEGVIQAGEILLDEESLMKRLRTGNEISCMVILSDGKHLLCSVTAHKYSLNETCTCGANYFCRHAAATVLAYIQSPDSFLDLDRYLEDLGRKDASELVAMLRTMISRYPASTLEALKAPGFETSEVFDLLADGVPDEDDLEDWDEDSGGCMLTGGCGCVDDADENDPELDAPEPSDDNKGKPGKSGRGMN